MNNFLPLAICLGYLGFKIAKPGDSSQLQIACVNEPLSKQRWWYTDRPLGQKSCSGSSDDAQAFGVGSIRFGSLSNRLNI